MNPRTLGIASAALTLSCVGPSASTAELEVQQAVARFSDATNHAEWSALDEMFTEDAVWETRGKLPFHFEGIAAIRDGLAKNLQSLEIVFQSVSPTIVRLDGPDRASARSSLTELLRFKSTGVVKRIYGVYDDRLVKRDGRWRFTHRTFELRFETDERTGEHHGQ